MTLPNNESLKMQVQDQEYAATQRTVCMQATYCTCNCHPTIAT